MLDAMTWVVDNCELPCGCCKVNLGPVEEQWLLLNTEPLVHSFIYWKELYSYCIFWSHILLPQILPDPPPLSLLYVISSLSSLSLENRQAKFKKKWKSHKKYTQHKKSKIITKINKQRPKRQKKMPKQRNMTQDVDKNTNDYVLCSPPILGEVAEAELWLIYP